MVVLATKVLSAKYLLFTGIITSEKGRDVFSCESSIEGGRSIHEGQSVKYELDGD